MFFSTIPETPRDFVPPKKWSGEPVKVVVLLEKGGR